MYTQHAHTHTDSHADEHGDGLFIAYILHMEEVQQESELLDKVIGSHAHTTHK